MMNDIVPPIKFAGRRDAAQRRIRSLVERACREMGMERLNLLSYTIAAHFLAIDGSDYQTARRVAKEIQKEQAEILSGMSTAVEA